MAEETRYWKRMGMRVTKSFALEASTKMKAAASYHDDETLEFVQVSFDTQSAEREIETLFSQPDTQAEGYDGANQVLLKAMELHKERGKRIKKLRKTVRKEVLAGDDLKPLADYVTELIEKGYDESYAKTQYEQDLQAKVVNESEQQYQAWYDGEVIALQKQHGVYKEPDEDDDDEEE